MENECPLSSRMTDSRSLEISGVLSHYGLLVASAPYHFHSDTSVLCSLPFAQSAYVNSHELVGWACGVALRRG